MFLRDLVVDGLSIVLLAMGIIGSARAQQTQLPPNALLYLPMLQEEIDTGWPDVPVPSALGAQVEQETCISLKHTKCWNPKAELKTSREYGFGFGQLTVTSKFDAFKEVKGMDPRLAHWSWDDRYDPQMQLRSLVVKMRFNYKLTPESAIPPVRQEFATAGYNGGIYGTLGEIKLCKSTKGCNPDLWFGHVENTSKKSKKALGEYAKSFFAINREYLVNVFIVRRARYLMLHSMGAERWKGYEF